MDFAILFRRWQGSTKYTNPYGKVARGTAGESAGNAFYWKSLNEKRKHTKTVQGQKRGRGERRMRAA